MSDGTRRIMLKKTHLSVRWQDVARPSSGLIFFIGIRNDSMRNRHDSQRQYTDFEQQRAWKRHSPAESGGLTRASVYRYTRLHTRSRVTHNGSDIEPPNHFLLPARISHAGDGAIHKVQPRFVSYSQNASKSLVKF